jgi:hypothetical protein
VRLVTIPRTITATAVEYSLFASLIAMGGGISSSKGLFVYDMAVRLRME